MTLLPHPSHPSLSESLPRPWLTLPCPARCSRAAQPPHDPFEDTSQDPPNSAPSPKYRCGSSPMPWAPLAPACFWSLLGNEVPKGDSELGAGSAQLPARGGCTSLLPPAPPNLLGHSAWLTWLLSPSPGAERGLVMVRAFTRSGLCVVTHPTPPPHFMDPHPSLGSPLSAGSKSEA